MSGLPWDDFAAPAPAAAPAAPPAAPAAPAAGGSPWDDFAGSASAAPAEAAAPPTGIPGLAPGSAPVAPTNGMAERVARMKAAPPTLGQKIGGAVEAALHLATGMINFPVGVVSTVVGNTATAAGEGVGAVQTALDRRSRGVPTTLPGDPKIGDAAESPIEGKYMRDTVYQPTSDTGQEYVEDTVAPAMNALGPVIGHGHDMHTAAPAAAPAARAVGDATRPVAAATGRAAAKGVAKVIGVDPELAKVAQIAGDLKHPIDVRPDQVVKGAKFSKLAGQAASDVPLSNSKTKSNQVNFTRNVINELNPEETADRLTPETFSKAMDRSGSGIGDIMGRTKVPLDAEMRSATDSLRKDVMTKATDADAKIVNAYIDELHSKAGEDGVIDGAALRELNSEIGLRARQNVGNDLGTRLNDLQGIIEDGVQKNVDPKDGAALKDFRRQYAYGKILEPTVAKTIDGVLPPSQLMGAVTRTTLGKHLMAMSKGGPMGDLAKVGQLIKEPGSSGTAERHLVYGAGLGGLGYVEPHTAATAYGGALGYNTLGPKLTRAMVGKRAKKAAPPAAEPPAPPPEPTTSPGASGPRGGGGGGAPGPLGDLTPDWSTTPGAGGSPPPGGIEPTGLHRALDEPPVTTGNRKAKLEVPPVPGRPDLPDTMVSGGPAETAASERSNAAMHEPGAIEARRQQGGTPPKEGGGGGGSTPPKMPSSGPSMSETTRLLADEKQPPAVRKVLQDHLKKLQADETEAAAQVAREHDAQALERAARETTDSALQARLLKQADALRDTEKIPVGKVIEGQPEIKTPKAEKIPAGKVIEGEPTPPEPIPKGEATEITPEYIEADRAWRAEHKLGAEDAQRARAVAAALEHDEKAVQAAVRQFENQPRAFDREIARITDEGEARANESKLAAERGTGDAEATGAPVRSAEAERPAEPVSAGESKAGRVAEPDVTAAVRAGDEQPRAERDAKAGTDSTAPTAKATGGQAPAGAVERRSLTGGSIFDRLAAEGAAQKKRLAGADVSRAATEPAKAGVEIREVPDGFEAYRDGKKVGYLKDNLERGQAEQIGENANVDMVKVDKDEVGKGTGRALYAAFNEKHGGRIMPSGKTEPSAWKLWKRNYPEKVDAFVEQEAARIRDGADRNMVIGNITDPEVAERVLKASEPEPPKPTKEKTDGEQLQPDAVRTEADKWSGNESPEEIFSLVDQTKGSPEFKNWFGNSKAVTEEGEPRVMFTGTSKDVDFSKFKAPKNGIWFTDDPKSASDYALDNDNRGLKYNPDTRGYDEVNTASRVMPVFLKLENPKVYEKLPEDLRTANNYKRAQALHFDALKAEGYDGVQFGDGTTVVFDPKQIKSAIGNDGSFDAASADILHKHGGDTAAPKQYLGTHEALDNVLREKFGDKFVQGLLDQGVLKFAKNTDEQPPGPRAGIRALIRRPAQGQSVATLYYDKITAEQAPGILMHELGEHFGIVRLLGQERYNVMLNDLRKLKDEPEVRAAWDRVKRSYLDPRGEGVGGVQSTEDPKFMREVAAHLVETQPDLPFVRRLINEIRAFFYEKFGSTLVNKVDANLIRGLAAAALRKASTGTLPYMKTNVPPVAYKPFVASSSRIPAGRAPMTQ